jgi:hypothetical protein
VCVCVCVYVCVRVCVCVCVRVCVCVLAERSTHLPRAALLGDGRRDSASVKRVKIDATEEPILHDGWHATRGHCAETLVWVVLEHRKVVVVAMMACGTALMAVWAYEANMYDFA